MWDLKLEDQNSCLFQGFGALSVCLFLGIVKEVFNLVTFIFQIGKYNVSNCTCNNQL